MFCSISEAVHEYPDLVKKHMGSVIPVGDNYYTALNSAVFSDGSFCYIPKGVKSPMELSTYFRINASDTGQFERTLIVAEEGSYVSYLEGCTAPSYDTNQVSTSRHARDSTVTTLEDIPLRKKTCFLMEKNFLRASEGAREGRKENRKLALRATPRDKASTMSFS